MIMYCCTPPWTGNLCTLLSKGRGLAEVYQRLLDVVDVEGEGGRRSGRRGQTQKQLEQYIKKCLYQNAVDVSDVCVHS